MRMVVALGLAVVVWAPPGAFARQEKPAEDRPLYLSAIKPKDSILFLGDAATIGAAWPRQVASALLALRPDDGLRVNVGGWDGATIAPDPMQPDAMSAAEVWAPRLMFTVKPTVVFVCLGQEDGYSREADAADAERYGRQLSALIERKIVGIGARAVFVMSPPAAEERNEASRGWVAGYNATLSLRAKKAEEVAKAKGWKFIDLYGASAAAYDARQREIEAAARRSGEPMVPGSAPPLVERPPRLTAAGLVPNRLGSAVIAHAVLRGLGVADADLSRVGWPPIPGEEFEKNRSLLPGLAPEGSKTAAMYSLSNIIDGYNTHFEVLWKHLEMRLHPAHSRRADILTMHRLEVESDWQRVLEAAKAAGAK